LYPAGSEPFVQSTQRNCAYRAALSTQGPVALFSLRAVCCVPGSLAAWNTRLKTVSWLAGHLVDAHGDRQDEDIVLSGLDLHTVGIAHPEPLLGNLSHLLPALTDRVLMVENIALHFQVGPAFDLDRPAFAHGCDQGLLDYGHVISSRALDFHAVLDAQYALLDLGQFLAAAVFEDERL